MTEGREFRTMRWLLVLLACGTLAALVGGVLLQRSQGWSFTVLGLVGTALLFGVAFVEGLVARVVLSRDSLEIVSNFRRTVVPRSDLVRAVAEKGSPIALERAAGGWIRLPGTLSGPHVNTLRAWLKRADVS